MSRLACSRLDEVRSALVQGYWPEACAVDLLAHVEGCTRCAQEVLLTTHLRQIRTATVAAAQPIPASLLWWRAQVRRRNAALERAGRPIAAAQIFALGVAAAVILCIVVAYWRVFADHAPSTQSAAAALAALRGEWGLPLLLALALITALGGVVVYLASDRR